MQPKPPLDIAPVPPPAAPAGEVATLDALRARLRRRAQHLVHLATALPVDLPPEQRLLVDRALDELGQVTTRAATAAGLERTPRGTVVTGTAEPVHFVGANRVLPEGG